MIIDTSYFDRGELLIEGISEGTTTLGQAMAGEVGRYIERYETEYIIATLGYDLAVSFNKYVADIQQNPDTQEPVKGFEGLRSMLTAYAATPNTSPVANYVFFHYVRQNQVRATSLGVTQANSDNRVVSATGMLCRVWNEMVSMNRVVADYVLANFADARYDTSLLETISSLGL